MTRLIGNALIFLVCALNQLNTQGINQRAIIILLIALILSIFEINNANIIGKTSVFLYLVACIFIPSLATYIPVMLWQMTSKHDYLYIILLIINISQLFISDEPIMAFTVLITSVFALFINQLISSNEILKESLKRSRDTYKEHELLIEQKNRELLKSQDAEVYTATLKERNRIAREIHDNVGHMLTRSILQIGAIKTINKDVSLAEPLNNLHDTLNTAMTNIRESVHDLHDESIDLKNAINDVIKTFDNLSILFDYDMGKNVPRNIKYCFISVVKEAINNTVKHSNADKVTVILREHPGFYQLLIEDNGTNINIDIKSGIGLNNIHDRVNSLGGNVKIMTENGFKIIISIFKERTN